MAQELQKSPSITNELSATATPSSQDLVLARMLELAAQITRQEVLPGEIRFWSETFRSEDPEMLEWAFREYLKKGKFFPKPADISELIEDERARDKVDVYEREAILRAQFQRHGCSSGWIFKPGGVIRCPQCAEIAQRSKAQ